MAENIILEGKRKNNRRRAPYPTRYAKQKTVALPVTTEQATASLASAMAKWATTAARVELKREN